MAIVKMSKFTLLSFESHKEELLKKLHLFGNVEFENLNDSKEELPFYRKDGRYCNNLRISFNTEFPTGNILKKRAKKDC